MLSVDTEHIALTSKDHYSTVVSLDKMLPDEKRLSRHFMFPITTTIKQLKEAYKMSKEQQQVPVQAA